MYNAAIAKLFEFGRLRVGWNYGDGVPTDAGVLKTAAEFLLALESIGFRNTSVFPGTDGEVLIRAYQGTHCLGFVCELDGTFTIFHDVGEKQKDCPDGVGFGIARMFAATAYAEIRTDEWLTSASLIPSTSMNASTGSLNLPLKRVAAIAEPRSLIVNVSRDQDYLSANTFKNTTQASAETHQYSVA